MSKHVILTNPHTSHPTARAARFLPELHRESFRERCSNWAAPACVGGLNHRGGGAVGDEDAMHSRLDMASWRWGRPGVVVLRVLNTGSVALFF